METGELKIGQEAPAVSLPDQNNEEVNLKDFAGKWVVLYFYPKDNTSGCTIEALDFTSAADEFRKLNAEIIGISPDSCKSHQNFVIKHDLGITLLSDTEKKILLEYGVWQKKKMYGKEYHGVVRTTFLIDPTGKIVFIWKKVKVKGHVEDVKNTLKEMIS